MKLYHTMKPNWFWPSHSICTFQYNILIHRKSFFKYEKWSQIFVSERQIRRTILSIYLSMSIAFWRISCKSFLIEELTRKFSSFFFSLSFDFTTDIKKKKNTKSNKIWSLKLRVRSYRENIIHPLILFL